MGTSTPKPFRHSKKALFASGVAVATFAYLGSLLALGAPWETHGAAWDFLAVLCVGYLGSQSLPDTAAAYRSVE